MAAVAEEATGVERRGDVTARVTTITDALNQNTRFTYNPATVEKTTGSGVFFDSVGDRIRAGNVGKTIGIG